jgi:hypothetical protein
MQPGSRLARAVWCGRFWFSGYHDRPTGNTVERYVHTNDAGTFTVSPEPQEGSEYFEATQEETMELPDGTEATPKYMEPTMEGGNYDPFWEDSFEKQEYYHTLPVPLADPSGDVARRALSSMVEVPEKAKVMK